MPARDCSGRNASWPSPMARFGSPMRAAASSICSPTAGSESSRNGIPSISPASTAKLRDTLKEPFPNGLAFAANGDILIANFGTDRLEIMTRDGESKVLADHIDGQPIGKVNFVLRDSKNRIWITVSTRIKNWMHALRPDLPDGYIARYIDGTFRIVAEGFHFTNEIRMDAREEYMYVAETTGGCISRMRVNDDGSLGEREVFGPSSLGKGAWPDGIAFDSGGNLWGTMVYSDKLFVLSPQGDLKQSCSMRAIPKKSMRWRRHFFKNQVNEQVLVRDRAGYCALDGQRHIRRPRSADALHRIVARQQYTVSSGRRCRVCPWSIGRILWEPSCIPAHLSTYCK